ncbi:MAG: SDR family oxidoreductase [Tatlockia sp.]|nr:SDR family oxidoreductase [Tatlockia sp.]
MAEPGEDRVALVTGSGLRLGKDIALHLAKKGYKIALHYCASEAQAQDSLEEIKAINQDCQLFPLDFSKNNNYEEYLQAIEQRLGRLKLLVNSASYYTEATIQKATQAQFEKMFRINLQAPFFLSQAFYNLVQKGSIINIIDNKMHFNQYQYSHYLLSKKALAEFTKMAALEFAPRVRVNGIAPGVIMPKGSRTKEYLAWRIKGIPLGFQGDSADILQGIDYLLSSYFVTGEILTIDGGESANKVGNNFSSFQE